MEQKKAHGKGKSEFWALIGRETQSPWNTTTFYSTAVYSAVFPEPVRHQREREKKETRYLKQGDWRQFPIEDWGVGGSGKCHKI